mmetsp:Transcript_8845/g.25709  ORF Transcript_8845/g.25709 Transcript_8845/m.25709 type:complete len:221 (-) Transcript_8845:736-1398(-)
MPTKVCASGQGRCSPPKWKVPWTGCARRNSATSSWFGSVALMPQSRTSSCVASTRRCVRATMDSMTAPRSSASRCTSSRMSSRTDSARLPSPPFRVTTSHFSGVVTMRFAASASSRVSCASPVYSRTVRPRHIKRLLNLLTTSCASAFMGATYTALTARRSSTPSAPMAAPTCCRSTSMATFVLPAPVGAHTRMLPVLLKAASKTVDCMGLKASMPLNGS